MKQQGVLVEKEGDSRFRIEITPHGSCHKCGACSAENVKTATFFGDIPEEINIGDRVEIEVEPAYLMRSYLILYILPLLIFFPVLFIVFKVTESPLISFLSGACGMFFSYIIAGIFFQRHHQISQHLKIRKI